MAFSFNFANDDLEGDADVADQPMGESKGIGAMVHNSTDLIRAKELSLEDIYRMHALQKNEDDQTTENGRSYPRRELQDIRTQIMAESDPSTVDEVLEAGLSSLGDLSSGIYEGGFKTWECSYDLAAHIERRLVLGTFAEGLNFVELGTGTALPSSVVLDFLLRLDPRREAASQRVLILADYNEAVIRLATVPNLFLTWYEGLELPRHLANDVNDTLEDGYVEATNELKARFLQDLQRKGIRLVLVAGGWGPDFVDMVRGSLQDVQSQDLVVAASETIYSPKMLNTFTDTVLHLLGTTTRSPTFGKAGQKSIALIAAKQIYFGVGGGVDEFKRAVVNRGASVEDLWTGGQGVERWIGQVRE